MEREVMPNTPKRQIRSSDTTPISSESAIVFLAYAMLFVTFPLSIWFCLETVAHFQRIVIFRLGRLRKGGVRGPGLVFILPCVDEYVKVDLRTQSFDVHPQEVLTRDSVTIQIDAVVYYSIQNPLDSVIQIRNVHESTKFLAQTTLRNIVGTKNLMELLTAKESLSRTIGVILDEATDPWGVKVERVEIKDVRLPIAMQRAMAAEAEALREAKAKIVAAEGELSASKALKEASDVMSTNPITLQLRYLQTLSSISSEHNSTIIFPFPIDLMSLGAGISSSSSSPSSAATNQSKQIQLPRSMQRAMATEREAEREAQAKIVAAKGELDASINLKEASDVMKENPVALQLRYLQTLNTISNENNHTIVFPFPVDLLRKMFGKSPQNRMEEPCIKFLSKQLESLQLPYKVYHINGDAKKPLLIGTWVGTQSELPSILLNSHMDVVPVFEDKWTHPPFAADIDAEGRIFARGTQDMKSVGAQYLAALRALKKTHKQMRRTVHIAFVPDEEIGGETSLQEFVKTSEFLSLNVGFALDEGMATTDEKFVAFYAERSIWQINFKFKGTAGHGSLLLSNTAGKKLAYLLNKLMTYRSTQQQIMDKNPSVHVGDVTTINLTQLKGGVQSNVVPPQLEACFDMRLAIEMDLKNFEEKLKSWCTEAGGDIEWEWVCKIDTAPATKVNGSNQYWVAFEKAFKEMFV